MDAPRKGERQSSKQARLWQKALTDRAVWMHRPSVEIRRHGNTGTAVEKLRERVEDGDGYAVLVVIVACLRAGMLPPLWAIEPFLQRYDAWDRTFQKRTLDAAFGVSTRHTNKQLRVLQRNARLRPLIVRRVMQLSNTGTKSTAGDKRIKAVCAEVAEEIRHLPDTETSLGDPSIKGRTVEDIFYESESADWKRLFEALDRVPKAPPNLRPRKIT